MPEGKLQHEEIRIPERYAWLEWPSRRDGIVRIYAFLLIPSTRLILCRRPPRSQFTLETLKRYFDKERPPFGIPVLSRLIPIPMKIQFEREELRRLFEGAPPSATEGKLRAFYESQTNRRADRQPVKYARWLSTVWPGKFFLPGRTGRLRQSPTELLRDWAAHIAMNLRWHALYQHSKAKLKRLRGELRTMTRAEQRWALYQARKILRRKREILLEEQNPSRVFPPWVWRPAPSESRFGWSLQILRSRFCDVEFSVFVPRPSLQTLGKLIQTEDGFKEVQLQVANNLLLSDILVDWVQGRVPPNHAHFLLKKARAALFAANHIIYKAAADMNADKEVDDDDDELLMTGDEIHQFVRADPVLRHLAKARAVLTVSEHPKKLAAALVDRAFERAWDLFHVKRLAARKDPYEIFESADRENLYELFSEHPEFLNNWKNRLFGPPGQAARDEDLLAPPTASSMS